MSHHSNLLNFSAEKLMNMNVQTRYKRLNPKIPLFILKAQPRKGTFMTQRKFERSSDEQEIIDRELRELEELMIEQEKLFLSQIPFPKMYR